jgi:hypothetical protein
MSLSKLHEELLLLFRNRPTLAPEVLRDTLKVPVPDFTEARIETGDLTEVVPRELRADQVVVLYDGAARVMSIVVEVQLQLPDRKKLRAWPNYVTGAFARYDCQACLLVVSTDRAVAARCGKPIVVGPGSTIGPIVLGPRSVPVITAAEQARSVPEVAVLSAMAHGRTKVGLKVALAALAGLAGLEEERALLYGNAVLSSLHKAAKRALEAMMASGDYQITDKFLLKYIAKGKREGRAEGKAEGKAEGRAEGKAEDVLEVLEARGLAIPDDVRQRVAASTDLAELGRWLRRAVVVRSAGEIFDETP